MTEPFVGEIRIFAGNFAPRGWAFCDGQLLPVSQNDALFSLLGTIYGGDGRTTFGLPDLRGRAPIHQGQGPGLSTRYLGSKAGTEKVTLTTNQMPAHGHTPVGSTNNVNSPGLNGKVFAKTSGVDKFYAPPNSDKPNRQKPLINGTITNAGGNQAHENMGPFLTLNYIIALFGVYPSRS